MKKDQPYWFRKCEKEWKRQVLNGQAGKDAHHVLPKSVYPHLRHEPMNGIALERTFHSWAENHATNFMAWLRTAHRKKWEWAQEHKYDKRYRDLDYEEIYNRLTEIES